jgi:hypothetical protein
LFVGLDEELSLEMNVVYTRRTARPHLDAAALIKRHENQPKRKTRDLRTRVAKRIEVDGGILEHLL